MSAFLQVQEGDSVRDIAILTPGKLLTIGRGETNDVSFPQELRMSFHHCTLQFADDKCVVRDSNSSNGTFVNGEQIETAELVSGDVFECGTLRFLVEWSMQAGNARPVKASPSKSHSATLAGAASSPALDDPLMEEVLPIIGFSSESASEIIEQFQLNQEILFTPEDGESPDVFTERLLTLDDATQALQFLSFGLARRCGVWWALECIRSGQELTPPEELLANCVIEWLNEPSEGNRRTIADAIQEHGEGSLISWPAQAAFYAHGSTTPANAPTVPPAINLCGKMIFAGVTLAAVEAAPQEIASRRREFADLGLKIAAGEHPWTPVDA